MQFRTNAGVHGPGCIHDRASAVVFVAGAVDESSVVFENAKHAFPQRIGYRKDGPNAVLAWIEGSSKSGAVRHVDFRYRQVACAGH